MLAGCTAEAPPGGVAATKPPASGQAPLAAAAPATVPDVFPPAAERELVLNNCASCHNVACAAIGQRPAARWDALLASHRDRLSGVDLDRLFGYLKEQFNDGKPEPKVPSGLLEGGCTPF